MKQSNNKIFVIVGPTSTGKTSLAIELCKKYNGEIISADSRQIYKNMDIGTGKTPIGYAGKVKVYGYDLVEPDQAYSAYDFAVYAQALIKSLIKNNKTPFLVGGTGLYIDMVMGRVKPSNVKPDPLLRKELEGATLEQLQAKLKYLNEKEYKKVDQNNPVRLVRAIEKHVNKKAGKPLEKLNQAIIYIGLTAPREILYMNSDAWADFIWKNGILDETQQLLNAYPNSPRLNGLVYKTVTAFLTNQMSEEEALQRIKYDLHAYIRRQLTYFKKNTDIVWIDITQDKFKQTIYNILDG